MIPQFYNFRGPAGLAGLELSATEKSFPPRASAQAWPDRDAQSRVMENLNLWSHLSISHQCHRIIKSEWFCFEGT